MNLQRCTYTHTASLSPSFQASVNTELVRCLSRTARGTLPPLAAAVGGLASQEVLKAITGKFAPLQQWVGHWICTSFNFNLIFFSPVNSISLSVSPAFSFISMPSRSSGRFSLFLLRSFSQGAIATTDCELVSVNRCV